MAKNKKYKKINILISGYGPFGSIIKNPSELLVKEILLNKENIEKELKNSSISFTKIFEVNKESVDKNLPYFYSFVVKNEEVLNLIVHFGVNQSLSVPNLECRSVNLLNDPYISYKNKIKDNGKDFYLCTLPVMEIYTNLNKNGNQCEVSFDAGTFYCNYIYYNSCFLYNDSENTTNIFVHIPSQEIHSIDNDLNLFKQFCKIIETIYLL